MIINDKDKNKIIKEHLKVQLIHDCTVNKSFFKIFKTINNKNLNNCYLVKCNNIANITQKLPFIEYYENGELKKNISLN